MLSLRFVLHTNVYLFWSCWELAIGYVYFDKIVMHPQLN